MKEKLRKVKGITLIALVITIIVLLILAGVSIAMLTGENGILTQAQNASKQTEIAEEKEQIALAYNGVKTKKEGEDVTSGELDAELKANGADATATGTDPITVTFNDSKRSYTIDANGNITGPESEESGETGETEQGDIVAIMKIEGTKVETPLIPTGFSHIDGTVDDGYVIQDGDGNQFVWVPVDKDQKLQINVTSKEDIESITLKDPYGDTILTVNNEDVGTSYTNENVEPTINGPYVLNVKTASLQNSFYLGVHSLYAKDTMSDWEKLGGDNIEEQIEAIIEAYKEMASQQGYSSIEEWCNAMLQQEGLPTLEEMGFTTFEEYLITSQLETLFDPDMKEDYYDTEDYTKSVNKNGGFYIGRYEASYQDGKVASKKSTVANASGNLENGKLWNDISQTDALSYSKSMYESEEFTSSLLTGAAWDRTLGWLEETGAVPPFEIVKNSESWGIYRGRGTLSNTGEYSRTEKNHIYDLAGNVTEWTTEMYSTRYRVYRGR